MPIFEGVLNTGWLVLAANHVLKTLWLNIVRWSCCSFYIGLSDSQKLGLFARLHTRGKRGGCSANSTRCFRRLVRTVGFTFIPGVDACRPKWSCRWSATAVFPCKAKASCSRWRFRVLSMKLKKVWIWKKLLQSLAATSDRNTFLNGRLTSITRRQRSFLNGSGIVSKWNGRLVNRQFWIILMFNGVFDKYRRLPFGRLLKVCWESIKLYKECLKF